jgi:hypothetical protein
LFAFIAWKNNNIFKSSFGKELKTSGAKLTASLNLLRKFGTKACITFTLLVAELSKL